MKEIIANATAAQDEYMFHFDLLSQYMFRLNVPKETVDRVKDWCRHTWKTQKSFDELALLGKYLINNPKTFNVEIDDLGAKPCIPYKSLLQ